MARQVRIVLDLNPMIPNDSGMIRGITFKAKRYDFPVSPVDQVASGEQTSHLILNYVSDTGSGASEKSRSGHWPESTDALAETLRGNEILLELDHYQPPK